MILLQNRLDAIHAFRNNLIEASKSDEFLEVLAEAKGENPFFTKDFVSIALDHWVEALSPEKVKAWSASYPALHKESQPKKVGLLTAGNIPFVGLHDILSVLISGHDAYIKPSSKDNALTKWMLEQLYKSDAKLRSKVKLVEKLQGVDALIATGSSNTARLFDYYFREVPRLIRSNRVSVAILDGAESQEELKGLGQDIMLYFGMGCRNISYILLPKGYELEYLCGSFTDSYFLQEHSAYMNNYDYQRAIMLMDKQHFYDVGFLTLQQSQQIISPLSKIHYGFYSSPDDIKQFLEKNAQQIQVLAGSGDSFLPLGQAQFPELTDYADNRDTVAFLLSLQ